MPFPLTQTARRGVSYIFAGAEKIHIKTALNKLCSIFGIRKLLLEGVVSLFLCAGAVDELSLVTAPIIAYKNDKPLLTDSDICEFRLISAKPMQDNSVVFIVRFYYASTSKYIDFSTSIWYNKINNLKG